jgi:uncharacterized protein DUF5681
MSSVENNGGTTRPGGVTGKGFTKGVSGNPGGRPKGIAAVVRALTSPEKQVQRLLEIADDPKARPSDRIRATELLLAYGWGKPPATVAPEGYDPLELDAMSAEAAAIVDELAQRRKANDALS